MNKQNWRGKSEFVTRLGRVPLVCLVALGVSPALGGCSSDQPLSREAEDIGSLGFNLQAAPGVTLNTVTYAITGNGFTKEGSIDTSGASAINGAIGGIPAGNGYTITLTAKSTENDTTFTGSARFNVSAGITTPVAILLRGNGTRGNKGSVAVNGTINVGPVVDELTVTPQTVNVGSSISLSTVGLDADNGPSPLSYYWTTTGGVITNPIQPNATLTSATPGTFTVTLTVSDGDLTDSISTSVTFAAPAGGGGEEPGPVGSSKKPNVLLIIADDLGAESTSLYPTLVGETGAVPVPNLEALAANGLVFDNAWASPACSMTRGTIVSGLYGYRTGVTSVGAVLPTDTVSIFDRITAENPSYSQALFGKYHLGGSNPTNTQHVTDIGVPLFRGILSGGVSDYFKWTTYDTQAPPISNTTFATTALTNYAVDYIRQHKATKPNEPWFVYQAYNAPHSVGANNPYQVPPAELHHVDLSSVGNPTPGTIATNIPVYKSLIQSLDTELGRLLAEVDLNETVVIFVGDNGTPAPVKDNGTGVRGSKGSVYEGGVRVPLIVTGAGVTRRGREDDLIVTSDLYATILSLTGINLSHVNNSYSIKPLLSNAGATSGRTHSFSETSNGTSQRRFATKDTRFKLAYNVGAWELYDLVSDPLETTNLYKSATHAAVRSTLEAQVALLKADAKPGYFP